MAKIFYVEDDANLSFVVKDCLQIAGHEVHHFTKGDDALKAFLKFSYDICLLDVMLPNVDGFTLTKAIREKNPDIPIIFISARVQIEDKLEGLQIGGDDYIFKPFSIEEVLLKVGIFLKRNITLKNGIIDQVTKHQIGAFTFDYNDMELRSSQENIRLTGREADLLVFFINHKNKVLKRRDILIALWGKDDYFLGRSLDVFISRLRKFLSSDTSLGIENIPRVGFKFRVD